MRWILAALALAASGATAQDRAGRFDYYVLALSWQPTWCALEGSGSAQCDRPAGWTLHGLWPQYERGWPADCPATTRDLSPAEAAAMADIMSSAALAKYQWRKHGRCSGLAPDAYFAAARRAFAAADKPAELAELDRPVRLAAAVVEGAFLRANPDWDADTVTITCRNGRIHEARVCLTRDLEPRKCAPDVIEDCRRDDALLAPIQ